MSHPLRSRVLRLPQEPGVYLWKDKKGKIIYVGKAKNLKSRVSSYITESAKHNFRIQQLVKAIADFEVIITSNELEALLTERTMIRHHSPEFNIRLRDDKEYPHVRVDFREDWPRIEKVRKRKDDGATYVGPFGNAGHLWTLLKGIGRVFPLIRCSRHEFRHAKRPCTYYHMKMCLAPCVKDIDKKEYVGMLKDALQVLQGRTSELSDNLNEKMKTAAAAQHYELAAQYRDQINALATIMAPQSVITTDLQDADLIGMAMNPRYTALHVLQVRGGTVLGSDSFRFATGDESDEELLGTFLMQYYDDRFMPPRIFVPRALKEPSLLESALTNAEDDHPPKIHFPQRGVARELVDMADKNALYQLEEENKQSEFHSQSVSVLQDRLKLTVRPERMECIDISNLQGTAVVASVVCFLGGAAAKDQYRIYHIKDLPEGTQDDFASIYEVVGRRLRGGVEDNCLPDLLVIDGGKGQLGAALKAQAEVPEAAAVSIISLAKSRVKKQGQAHRGPDRSYERVFTHPEQPPHPLSVGSPEFRLLTSIRDEAHRFAITHHRKKRDKSSLTSELDSIPGVGPVLRTRLLREFSGLTGLKQASVDQIKSIKGVSETLAIAIHTHLNRDEA